MVDVIRMAPDVVARAKEAGCTAAELSTTPGGRFRIGCSCGWTGPRASCRTRTDALGALVHHLTLTAKAQRSNGVSLHEDVGPRL
jgi:hypothetical protein